MKGDRGTAFSGDQEDEKCNKYSVRKQVRRNHLGNINSKRYDNTKTDLKQTRFNWLHRSCGHTDEPFHLRKA